MALLILPLYSFIRLACLSFNSQPSNAKEVEYSICWPALLLSKHVNLYHFRIVLRKQELVSINICPYKRNAQVAGVFIETSVGQQRDRGDGGGGGWCLQSIYSHLRLLLIFI